MDVIFEKDSIEIERGDVIIGDNCWIGANVFICQGVKIGDYVIIGANSVVLKAYLVIVLQRVLPLKY